MCQACASTSGSDSPTAITIAEIIGMIIGIGIVATVIGACIYVAMKISNHAVELVTMTLGS